MDNSATRVEVSLKDSCTLHGLHSLSRPPKGKLAHKQSEDSLADKTTRSFVYINTCTCLLCRNTVSYTLCFVFSILVLLAFLLCGMGRCVMFRTLFQALPALLPNQVTGTLLLPRAYTPDRRDQHLTVSYPKTQEKWGKQN